MIGAVVYLFVLAVRLVVALTLALCWLCCAMCALIVHACRRS